HCPQMQRWFHVEDEKTVLFGIQFKNRSLVTLFALVQLVVACVSFAQHVYSVAIFTFYTEYSHLLLARVRNPIGDWHHRTARPNSTANSQ
uniref:Uncharacterized protein n=1 Tax=Caenorhabditis japonica TaxID=281687 RepID=A0A8R1EPY5_CAEJA